MDGGTSPLLDLNLQFAGSVHAKFHSFEKKDVRKCNRASSSCKGNIIFFSECSSGVGKVVFQRAFLGTE